MITYYASPDGSGNGLTANTPASLASVKAMVRAVVGTDNITVFLRGGRYELAAPLEFTAADSGTNGYTVYWKNYVGDAAPVVSGGIPVTGWTLHDAGNNIWKATVGATVDTRQLYVNGIRATRSRLASVTGVSTADDGLTYTSNDSTMPVFARPQDLEFCSVTTPWQSNTIMVDSVTRVGDVTTFTVNNVAATAWNTLRAPLTWPSAPYSLENAYEFLSNTTKGHWYLNNDTDTLYYVPLDGEDMATAEVIVPILEKLLYTTELSAAHDIQFDGLRFAHAGWLLPTTDRAFLQIQANQYFVYDDGYADTLEQLRFVQAAIEIYKADSVVFTNCLLNHLGGRGLHIGKGSKNCTASYNEVVDVSGSGICAGEFDNWAPLVADQVSNHLILRNRIHEVGIEYLGGIGVMCAYVDTTKIRYNEIYDLPYTGVSLGWGWNSPGFESGNSHGNEVGWNSIHDVMQILHDGGGFYSLGTQGEADPALVHDNLFYNIGNGEYPSDSMLYPDQGTRHVNFTNNVCVQTATGIPDKWLHCNAYLGYQDTEEGPDYIPGVIVATSNYATTGMLIGDTDGWSTVSVQPAIAIVGSDPSLWNAAPRAIALAAGLDGGITPTLRSSDCVATSTIELVTLVLTHGEFSIEGASASSIINTPTIARQGGEFTIDGSLAASSVGTVEITQSYGILAISNGAAASSIATPAITLSTNGSGIRSPSGISYTPRSITGEQLTIRRYSNGAWA
jgi:hypothetical protein